MWRLLALAALVCALVSPGTGWAGSAREENRRSETERLVDQILTGESVQGSVSRILYLGQQAYATNALLEALRRSPDLRGKRNVAVALSQFQVKAAEPALLELLKEDDAPVRMTALQGLARIKSDQPKKFIPLLKDRNLGVRREAARALGAPGKPQNSGPLMSAAREETEPEVRAALLIAVGDTGDKRQVRALEGFLKSSSESTRFAAAKALCRLGASSGFQVAQKLLGSSDRFERRSGLALFEGARARDVDRVLKPLLKDSDPTVAATAARILYQGGDQKMLEWLVLTSARSSGDAKLAYESELETLHLQDDVRKKILTKAGIEAPRQ